MIDYKLITGDIRIHGEYPTYNEIIDKFNDIIKMIQSEGLNIRDIKISCSFQNTIPSNENRIIIDREDFDRITNYKYIDIEEFKQLLQFMKKYSYNYMNNVEVYDFIERFLKLYNNLPDELINKFIPPNDKSKFCLQDEPLDINIYFKYNNIPYRLRRIIGKKETYQLCQEHLLIY